MRSDDGELPGARIEHNAHYRTQYRDRLPAFLVAGALFAAGTSCDRPQDGATVAAPGDGTHPGAGVLTEPGKAESQAVAGQTIYVPAYSAVATADNSRLYQLAITLGVRNTDLRHPIVVKSVRYHDRDGRLVRDCLASPLRLSPLAAAEFFVREGDKSGGTAASFVVEWFSEEHVNSPAVEAVMIGTAGSQGISFTCPGRVVADRGRLGGNAIAPLP